MASRKQFLDVERINFTKNQGMFKTRVAMNAMKRLGMSKPRTESHYHRRSREVTRFKKERKDI